jgi:hypothetical protein
MKNNWTLKVKVKCKSKTVYPAEIYPGLDDKWEPLEEQQQQVQQR